MAPADAFRLPEISGVAVAVKIGDVIEVNVEVIELVETGRRVRLKCECLVDGKVVLDGEGVLSVPKAQAPAS